MAGIIFLLDDSAKEYAPVSADRLADPPAVVVATVCCHADAPLSDYVKGLLKNKYCTAYQGDHFGSSDQYQTAWRIIRRVLDSNKTASVRPFIRNLEGILQNRTQTGSRVKRSFFQRLFSFLN